MGLESRTREVDLDARLTYSDCTDRCTLRHVRTLKSGRLLDGLQKHFL